MTPKQREGVRLMFGGKCAYCGCELPEKGWHADHVEPIGRKTKWVKEQGYVQTGECWSPQHDHAGNFYPSCRACNIHKSSSTLESWRQQLEDLVGVLTRGYPTFRHAERFGLLKRAETEIIFWFEKFRALEVDNGSN